MGLIPLLESIQCKFRLDNLPVLSSLSSKGQNLPESQMVSLVIPQEQKPTG